MEAVADSGLTSNGFDPSRIGVLLGAGTADLLRTERYLETMVSRGIEHARPSDVWNHFPSTPVDIIASHFGFEGLRSCIVAACSSSTMAIGSAADAIRDGRLDAADRRRHRRDVAADLQRVQRAQGDGSGARAGRSIAAGPG